MPSRPYLLPAATLLTALFLLAACESTASPTATTAPKPNLTTIADPTTATVAPTPANSLPEPTDTPAPQPTQAPSPVTSGPALDTLPAGWTRIEPGGETTCARDSPYHFWVRPGTINKLLLFFEGGGGCWNVETCREGSTFFNDATGDYDSPTRQGGLLDLDHPENPFRDYHAVYIPYCTGDVHMGDKVTTYKSDAGEQVTIHHKGFVNSSNAVQWAFSNITNPDSVFVTGCSAGSIGSIVFAPYVIRRYPDARVVQLGDSEAWVFDHPIGLQSAWRAHDNFPNWIPGVAAIKPGDFTMARFYSAIANYYPGSTFSQYNTAHDSVQQRFYFAASASPTPPPWEDALQQSLAEIHASTPNFRSYTAEGAGHCITPRYIFYTEQVRGVRFRDWINDLANGRPVQDLSP